MKYLENEEKEIADRWMREALKVAEKAMCLKAKCGTVVVKDGKIIGSGYNAPPLDSEENRFCNKEFLNDINIGKPKYDKTCCIHAEWRAIMDALKNNGDKIEGSKLYFTRVDEEGNLKKSGKPYCTVCSRLALDCGIDKFILWHEDGICEYDTVEYNKLSYEYKL